MDVPFRIRPANSADAAAMAAIERSTFTDAWPAAAFRDPGPGVSMLVAEGTAGIVGFVVLRAAADEGEVLDIVVVHEHRRRGIGTLLLRAGLALLERDGARAVHLEVRASNQAAQAFYARHGFRAVGRRAGYYRKPPEDAVLMRRPVTPVTPPA